MGECEPDCPMHPDAWKTDDTLKVTPHYREVLEKTISLRLIGVMSSSLILLALFMKGLGMSGSEI